MFNGVIALIMNLLYALIQVVCTIGHLHDLMLFFGFWGKLRWLRSLRVRFKKKLTFFK